LCDFKKRYDCVFASQLIVFPKRINKGMYRKSTYIYIGEKEKSSIRKSAVDIHNALPKSTLQVLPKLYHGEFSINHGNDYAQKIREIISI